LEGVGHVLFELSRKSTSHSSKNPYLYTFSACFNSAL
jgi:hypothetical protein